GRCPCQMACRGPRQEARVLPQDPAGSARPRVAGVLQDQANPDAGRQTPAGEPDGFCLRPNAARRLRVDAPAQAVFASNSLCPSRTNCSKVLGLAPPSFSIVSVTAK